MRTTKLLVVWMSLVFVAVVLASCGPDDPSDPQDTSDATKADVAEVVPDLDVDGELSDVIVPVDQIVDVPDKDTPPVEPDEISPDDETSEPDVPPTCNLPCETVSDCADAFDDLGDCEELACDVVAACGEDNDKQCVKKTVPHPCCETGDDDFCKENDDSICTCNEKCGVDNLCRSDHCDPLPDDCCKDIVLHKFNFDNIEIGGMPSPDLMTQNTHTTKIVKWSVQEGHCGSKALYLGDPDCGLYYNGQTNDEDGKCTPVETIPCTEATEDEDCPTNKCEVADGEVDGFCASDSNAERVFVELVVPEINLPPNALYTATFRLWMDAEESPDFLDPVTDEFLSTVERLEVYADPVSGPSDKILYTSKALENNSTDGACVLVAVDLTHLAGKSISLRLKFDTLDGTENVYEGIYIDDLTVRTYCGKDICGADSECDDDNLCTTEDNCVAFANLGGEGVCDNFQPDPFCEECVEVQECQGKGPHPNDSACYPAACPGGDPDSDPPVKVTCAWPPNPACCKEDDLDGPGFENGFESGSLDTPPYVVDEESGGVGWHLVDGAGYNESPDVEDFDTFAIQFSNPAGDSYDCGVNLCEGSFETPPIDFTNAPASGFMKLAFMLNLSTEWDGKDPASYADFDVLTVDAVVDGVVDLGDDGKSLWTSAKIFGTTNGETLPMWADLSYYAGPAYAGSIVTLRFTFDTKDVAPPDNAFAGPIIDEIIVEPTCDEVCTTSAECDAGGVCDLPQCVDGACDYGTPIPECCVVVDDPACNDANDCTNDTCKVEDNLCEHAFTGDPQCCSEQAFIFTDNFEDPENFNPLQKNYPANDTWTVPKAGNQCLDDECQDSEDSETCPADCNQAPVSWHVADFDQFSGSVALYFGDPETQSYDAPNTSFGTIRSPAFKMPPYGSAKVSFKMKLQTEHCDSWGTFVEPQTHDILTLSVVSADTVDSGVWSVPVKLWDSMAWDIKGCTWDPGQGAVVWKTAEVGLGLGADEAENLKDKALRFEFSFTSEDSWDNDFLGVLIDDFSVDVVCGDDCYSPYDCPESNPPEPHCTIETCEQGLCGATANPLKDGCCLQDVVAGYDYDGPCGMDGWTANPPAGQPRWQAHNNQKKSGTCALYFGDPAINSYEGADKGDYCTTSPVIDLTDPESDSDPYSQVEVSYWFWVHVEDPYFFLDDYSLVMDQSLFGDPVGAPTILAQKACSEVDDEQCAENPPDPPCDVRGCKTPAMGQWEYVSFVLDLSEYDWVPVPPYSAIFRFCFNPGDSTSNDAEGLYVDDFMIKTMCQ